MLSGLGAVGFGMGGLLYGAVTWLPFGWRALYAVGLAPKSLHAPVCAGMEDARAGAKLFFLPVIARELRETARFLAQRDTGAPGSFREVLLPIAGLLRQHPRRVVAIALIAALSNAGIGSSLQFVSQNLQTERGWSPGNFALFAITFGVFAIIGNPIAGRLGDRFGRRLVTSIALVLFPLTTIAFYLGPASLVALPWTLMVFLSMGSGVCVRVLATELFPTAYRGTGAGVLALLETVGVGAGLLVYTAMVSVLGNHSRFPWSR
jgi:MFS family permease